MIGVPLLLEETQSSFHAESVRLAGHPEGTMRELLAVGAVVALLANTPSLQAQTAPHLPKPDTPQSESTGPQDPRSTGSTTRTNEPLSDRLSESGGGVRPPGGGAPDD